MACPLLLVGQIPFVSKIRENYPLTPFIQITPTHFTDIHLKIVILLIREYKKSVIFLHKIQIITKL